MNPKSSNLKTSLILLTTIYLMSTTLKLKNHSLYSTPISQSLKVPSTSHISITNSYTNNSSPPQNNLITFKIEPTLSSLIFDVLNDISSSVETSSGSALNNAGLPPTLPSSNKLLKSSQVEERSSFSKSYQTLSKYENLSNDFGFNNVSKESRKVSKLKITTQIEYSSKSVSKVETLGFDISTRRDIFTKLLINKYSALSSVSEPISIQLVQSKSFVKTKALLTISSTSETHDLSALMSHFQSSLAHSMNRVKSKVTHILASHISSKISEAQIKITTEIVPMPQLPTRAPVDKETTIVKLQHSSMNCLGISSSEMVDVSNSKVIANEVKSNSKALKLSSQLHQNITELMASLDRTNIFSIQHNDDKLFGTDEKNSISKMSSKLPEKPSISRISKSSMKRNLYYTSSTYSAKNSNVQSVCDSSKFDISSLAKKISLYSIVRRQNIRKSASHSVLNSKF